MERRSDFRLFRFEALPLQLACQGEHPLTRVVG